MLSAKCGGTYTSDVVIPGGARGAAGIIPAGKRNLKVSVENTIVCDTDLEIFLLEGTIVSNDRTWLYDDDQVKPQAIFADLPNDRNNELTFDGTAANPNYVWAGWPDPLHHNQFASSGFSKAYVSCVGTVFYFYLAELFFKLFIYLQFSFRTGSCIFGQTEDEVSQHVPRLRPAY